MSYDLIKKINDRLLKEVPENFFPFQYGTIGAFLSGLLVPVLGTNAISKIKNDFHHSKLNIDKGSLSELETYIESINNPTLSKIASEIFNYINKEFFGSIQNFFQGEVWLIDSQISTFLENNEEYRDSLLLFVFSVPVFPVSEKIIETMINFHIFEPDETYVEMQAILNDYYTETPKCQRSYLSWKYLDSLPQNEAERIISKVEGLVPFVCDGCGRNIKGMKTPFISRIEVYPSRSLNFDYDDFDDKDFEKEAMSAIETAAQKSEKENNKSVWTEYRLFLCAKCRNTFVKRIDSGEFI